MAVFAYWNVAAGAQELEEQGYIEFLGLQITDPGQMKLVLLLPLLAGIAILCFYVTGQLW